MKFFLSAWIVLITGVQANSGFYNVNRAYFRYSDIQVLKSEDNCSFCDNEIWKNICEINHCTEESSQNKEYSVAVSKKLNLENIQSCSKCFNKIDAFKDIEERMTRCSLISTEIENLNFAECRENGQNCYLCLKWKENEIFVIVKNNNFLKDFSNIIFLIPLQQTQNYYQIESESSLSNFLNFNFTSKPELIHIPQDNIQRNHIKSLRIEQLLLAELQKGRSWLTLRNVAMAVALYYTIGVILVLGYYNFKKEKPEFQ